MYNEHFGLKQAPFRITPDTRLFFSGGGRGEILDALVYAVGSGEGIIKVVGEVGSGKTMLCRMLEERLPERVEIVYLANPSLSPDDILQAIALEMSLEVPPSANRLQVMHALQQRLVEKHAQNRQVVVFVEEAQSMPIDTLEEIRLLSNLETKREKLLQIVLFGQPELDDNLDQPNIRQLRERITHSFYLQPFSRNQLRDYVQFRMRAVGYRGPDVFHASAYSGLARASEGLTRRINILADKALLAAFADDRHDVNRKHIRKAINDSQFERRQRSRLPEISLGVGVLMVAGAVVWTLYGPTDSPPIAPQIASAVDDSAGPPKAPTAAIATDSAAASQAISEVAVAGSSEPAEAPAQVPAPAAEILSGAQTPDLAALEQSDAVPVEPLADASAAPSPPRSGTSKVSASAAESAPVLAVVADDPVPVMEMPTAVNGLILANAAPVEPAPVIAAEPTSEMAEPETGTALAAALPVINAEDAGIVAAPESQSAAETGGGATVGPSTAAPPGDAPAGLFERRIQVTRNWLKNASPDHYSIQLLLTGRGQRALLDDFLERRVASGEIDSVYVYETVINDRPYIGVLYREFESFSAARRALDNLPGELKRLGPFIRNVSDISSTG